MARKKSADTLDAEIAKVKSDMSKLQDRYDKLAEKLKDLQEQKRRIEADAIMWILRSGEAACPAVAEPPVRTDGATRLLSITPVHRGECHRPHALNGLSLDLLHGC